MQPQRIAALLALFLSLAFLATAAEKSTQRVYRINSKAISFLYYVDRHLVISADCLPKSASPGEMKCRAYLAFKRSSLVGLDVPAGGADPGAVICEKRFDARLEIGINEHGAEASFCRFDDDSRISTGSLDFASRTN